MTYEASACLSAHSRASAMAGRARATTLAALKQSLANPDHGWSMTAVSAFGDQAVYQIQSSLKEAMLVLTVTEMDGNLASILMSYNGTTFHVTDDDLAVLLRSRGRNLSDHAESVLHSIFE